MLRLAVVLVLVSCIPPHLMTRTTENGRGGVIDFDHRDREKAEAIARDFCGGNYRPSRVDTFESRNPFLDRRAPERIELAFECEANDGGT